MDAMGVGPDGTGVPVSLGATLPGAWVAGVSVAGAEPPAVGAGVATGLGVALLEQAVTMRLIVAIAPNKDRVRMLLLRSPVNRRRGSCAAASR